MSVTENKLRPSLWSGNYLQTAEKDANKAEETFSLLGTVGKTPEIPKKSKQQRLNLCIQLD